VVNEVLVNGGKRGRVPELWDGQAAQRIKQVLNEWLEHAPLVATG
jgi:UDP-N-acetylglucosamine 2-epimerase (non-hydrolysing)